MMNSNIYQFTTLGETLEQTLSELQGAASLGPGVKEQILKKFDEIANAAIELRELSLKEQEKLRNAPTHISGTEHEFNYHEGVWNLIIKDVSIKNDYIDLSPEVLKVIAVSYDNDVRRRRRVTKKSKQH